MKTPSPTDPIVLWTVQTLPAWEALQQAGVLRANQEHATEGFDAAYRWMAAQMRRRLRTRAPRGALPLWAWAQWRGAATARPDLRGTSHLPSGARGVRIEFALPLDQVLLSDFVLWHYVLNRWYLPESSTDDRAFQRRLAQAGLAARVGGQPRQPQLRREMEQSWTRIFNLGGRQSRAKRSIQAAFWQLRIDAVRAVDEFVAR